MTTYSRAIVHYFQNEKVKQKNIIDLCSLYKIYDYVFIFSLRKTQGTFMYVLEASHPHHQDIY